MSESNCAIHQMISDTTLAHYPTFKEVVGDVNFLWIVPKAITMPLLMMDQFLSIVLYAS